LLPRANWDHFHQDCAGVRTRRYSFLPKCLVLLKA